MRIWLGHALLSQFDTDAVAAVRRVIRETKTARYACRVDLYYHLLAACRVMRETFTGFDERYEKAIAAKWGWGNEVLRLADNYFDPGPWPDYRP